MKKLAIVGSGTTTRDGAPWDNPEYDIWVFNEAANAPWCKRWSACFQMHEPEIYSGHNTKDPEHWRWLQQKHFKPIYMQELDPRVPDSVRYPLEDAKALAGVDMFSSTFAYMAALAVLQNYPEIKIFGIEMAASEYAYQIDGYLFWFGFLRGRLGTLNVDNAILFRETNIFKAPYYGYEGNFSIGTEYFTAREKKHDAEWHAAEVNAKNIKKAIERAVDKKEYDDVARLTKEFQAAMLKSGEYAGAQFEAKRYSQFAERYADRREFEYASAEAQRDGELKKPLVWHYGGMAEYVWNVWKQTDNKMAIAQMFDFINQMGEAAYDTGALLGKMNENQVYMVKYDRIIEAGGRVLLEALV